MSNEEIVKAESENFVKIIQYIAKRTDLIVYEILNSKGRYSSILTKGVESFLARVTSYLKKYSAVLEETFNKTGKLNNDDVDITYEQVSSIAVFLDLFEEYLDEKTIEELDFYLVVIKQYWMLISVTRTLSE